MFIFVHIVRNQNLNLGQGFFGTPNILTYVDILYIYVIYIYVYVYISISISISIYLSIYLYIYIHTYK